MGFTLNPYDPCIANKLVNGKQCTVSWYVNDNKISHIDASVVTQIMEAIEKHFGKMMVVHGNKHVFLGMDIDFLGNDTVKIRMKSYIKDVIVAFGEDVLKGVMTPAQKDIFEVDSSSVRLSQDKSDLFHIVVAKLLYVSKRG